MTLLSQLIKHMLEERSSKQSHQLNLNHTNQCFSGVSGDSGVSSEASMVLMYADIAAIVPSFFITILLGGYSDLHGRIDVLMLSLVGAAIRLLIVIVMFLFNLSVYFLVLASFIDSFFGMSSTFVCCLYSYLSDITSNEERSYRLVVIEVFAGLGNILSNLLTGYFITTLGFLWSLIIFLSIIFLTIIYVAFLKESIDIENSSDKPYLSFKYFTDTYKLFKGTEGDTNSRFDLIFVLFIIFLISFGQYGSVNVQVLFIISFPLCLSAAFVGYFLTLVTTFNITSSWLATRFLGLVIGDIGLCLVGSVFGIAFYTLFALSTTKVLLFSAPLVGCLSTLPLPLLKSLASKIVKPDQTGLLFGSLSWAQLMGALVGIMVDNEVYANTVQSMPYMVFLLDACVYALVLLCLIFYIARKVYRAYAEEI